MADKEDDRPRGYRRGPQTIRGRQNRIYHHLGVRDLRELLDRKRSERGHVDETKIPPDPSYNYLKDPARETADHNPSKPYKQNQNNVNSKKEKTQSSRDIENPLNIKVEFSTSTGEHVYKLDETTVLPTIKHVPDRLPPQGRFRGRGRGRGRGFRGRPRGNASRQQREMWEREPPRNVSCEDNWDDLDQNKEVADQQANLDDQDQEGHSEEGSFEQKLDGSLAEKVERLNLEESAAASQEREKETSVSK